VPSSAVPVSVIGHDGTLGPDAFPDAFHAIVDPVSDPSAVPVTSRLLAHVALNDPFAVVDVCSVTDHLKSVHEDGDGARLADAHDPIRALTPGDDGPVMELECSNPVHAAAATAKSAATPHAKSWFFMRPVDGSQGAQGCGDGQYIKGRPQGFYVCRACRGTCLTPAR
jgi:hypothetical protein